MKKLFAKKTAPKQQTNVEKLENTLPANAFEMALEQHQLGNLAQADALYRQILQQNPHHVDTLHFLGILAYQTGQYDAAVELMTKALQIEPNAAVVYCNLGLTLQALEQLNEAVHNYQQALELQPNNIEAHFNLANLYYAQGQFDLAITHYQQVILYAPDFAAAYNNLGCLFKQQGKLLEAVQNFQHLINLNPHDAKNYYSLGAVFYDQKNMTAAIENFQKALNLQPNYTQAYYWLFVAQLYSCNWSNYANAREKIIATVKAGLPDCDPLPFLCISDNVIDQQQCAKTFAKNYPLAKMPLYTGQRYQHNKIRIAYLTADFHNHATAHLTAGLFEKHDKQSFELTAISFGRKTTDEMRLRLQRAFDRFIDVQNLSDHDIAKLLKDLEIDIAVDLKGYVYEDFRPGILAHRPAPIQVNYLAYPGTLGADYIDYIFADRYVIPEEHQPYYTEKVVYLPDSYQVNDSKRAIAEYTPSRTEVGLPANAFVFCCFNHNYKITPTIFDIWMRLLTNIPDSVLWLLEDNPFVANNLKKEAQLRNVAPERLVFAPRLKLDAHLARHRLADLFLDTLPYNAHTTTSDALWAGLPVVTCMGSAFAARVAGSLLHAIGLPELVTDNLNDYEALALKLATNPALLAEIKAKLAQNRTTYPLFDTDRFRRHIEAAYTMMWESHQRGEAPRSFSVDAVNT